MNNNYLKPSNKYSVNLSCFYSIRMELSFVYSIFITFFLRAAYAALPVVLWHGMGDSAIGIKRFENIITGQIPDIYVYSVQFGKSETEDIISSYYANINDQVDEVCRNLRNDPKLAKGFNFLGFSQGGQFARAVVQRCSLPVVNLLTFGAQHQGVYGLPKCPGVDSAFCDAIRKSLSYAAYQDYVQKHIVQATYWHDPTQEKTYREKSYFLAEINCERKMQKIYKENMLKLKNFVMVNFTQDTQVQPIASSTFGQYAPGQSSKVLPMEETDLYKSDRIGLKTLNEQGKLKIHSLVADHLIMTPDWFTSIIINNYLK